MSSSAEIFGNVVVAPEFDCAILTSWGGNSAVVELGGVGCEGIAMEPCEGELPPCVLGASVGTLLVSISAGAAEPGRR